MSLIATATKKSSIPLLEADTYPARCIAVIDTGDQVNEMSGTVRREVIIQFELPTETIEVDGEQKPRYMSMTYTMSLSEKAKLRSALETWRGKAFTEDELRGFNLANIVGLPCMLSVIHRQAKNGNTYANIGSISKPMKGMTIPEASSPLVVFDLDADDALDKMQTLPEWVQERIKKSPSYEAVMRKGTDAQGFMDINPNDLPF